MSTPGAVISREREGARSGEEARGPERRRAAADLAGRYRQVRETTARLAEPLSPEDATVQAMPDASPTKWHLAHTSWFFETFVLAPHLPGYREHHADFRVLFNSYYQTVGAQHPRPERGLVTRPGLGEVRAYRRYVDRAMLDLLDLLDRGELPGEPGPPGEPGDVAALVEIGLQHEQQHQELIVTDLKALFARNPLDPVYSEPAGSAGGRPAAPPAPLAWRSWEEGIRWVGHQGEGFAFDNEGPRHRVFLEAFELASRPVTVGEYLEFLADGGYARPELWLSDGWNEVRARGWQAPRYWRREEEGWSAFTLAGRRPLRPEEPVCHVSFYEADAYARWAGARLPREEEWEVAAVEASGEAGRFLEDCLADGSFHPEPAPPAGEAAGLAQVYGDVWEWTASPYVAFPGYRPPAGALGEYNGKFMCNQIVLRGGSCATPASHLRATYRNFFPPAARWQWSGIRLARDAG